LPEKTAQIVDSWQHFIPLLQLDTKRSQTLLNNLSSGAPPSFVSTFDQNTKAAWLKKAGFFDDEVIDLLYKLKQNGNFPAAASASQPQPSPPQEYSITGRYSI
jgi:hypothetical protein